MEKGGRESIFNEKKMQIEAPKIFFINDKRIFKSNNI